MRAALYARVSTQEAQNPETQLYALRQYAANHGWDIVAEYVDKASARDALRRTEWRKLLAHVRRGGIDVVLVTKIDRAFRSSLDCHNTLEYLRAHRTDFVASTQPIDTTTSMGHLMLGILAAMAEFERDLIRERVIDGMARAKAEGKHIGRPAGAKDHRKRKRRTTVIRYE